MNFQKFDKWSNFKFIIKKRDKFKIKSFPILYYLDSNTIVSYLFPSIGLTGIGTSSGIIHDFAGSFFVSMDNFSFGKLTKYILLELTDWKNIIGTEQLKKVTINLIWKNIIFSLIIVHSHITFVLNQLNFHYKNNYNMVSNGGCLLQKEDMYHSVDFLKHIFVSL